MKAVIVAGGKGKRLENLTQKTPKPMIKIGDKPLLEHQVLLFKRYGIKEVIFCTGFLADVIENHFGDGSKLGVKIIYSAEKEPLGSAGCLKPIESLLDEDFLLLYGDVMVNMDLKRLIEFHRKKKSSATLVAHPNDHPFDSDLIQSDLHNMVVGFLNKSHHENLIYRNLVNAGLYVLETTVFKYILEGVNQDLAKDIFPRLVKKERMFVYNTREYLKDMGTPERLRAVVKDYLSGKIERAHLSRKKPALFLDRDGVINREVNLLSDIKDFELLPNVPEAVRKINQSDYLAVVVSNQPVVARGLCTIDEVERIHMKMETLLGKEGAKLDAIYYCPHHPHRGYPEENKVYKVKCGCRKPQTGLLKMAEKDLNINHDDSYLIGDSSTDIETAKNFMVKSIGLRSGYGCKDGKFGAEPDFMADNLLGAVNIILSKTRYELKIKKIISKVESTSKKPFIISVGGLSRSGKTTFIRFLTEYLSKRNVSYLVVSMDNWLIPASKRRPSSNVIERYQLEKFDRDMHNFINGKEVRTNRYDPSTREVLGETIRLSVKNKKVLIIDGVCSLYSHFVLKNANIKIFVEIPKKIYLKRFFDFYKWKGFTKDRIRLLYEERMRDEVPFINKMKADLVVEGGYIDNNQDTF